MSQRFQQSLYADRYDTQHMHSPVNDEIITLREPTANLKLPRPTYRPLDKRELRTFRATSPCPLRNSEICTWVRAGSCKLPSSEAGNG